MGRNVGRWIATFADPATLSDLRAAASSCMGELCDCEPEECEHREQLMTPIEFFQWVEREVHLARREPVRFERGHRPRQKAAGRVHLAVASG